MLFFYRRKPKPPTSAIFTPLLKLFKTTFRRPPRTEEGKEPIVLETDTKSPFLLSGPKSQYGLGISLHFIIIPDRKKIDTDLIWKYARREMQEELIIEGLNESEADLYALRLIDPINPPAEIIIEYADKDLPVLESLQRLITYQLVKGQTYDETIEAISRIYGNLTDTFRSLIAKRPLKSADAAEFLEGYSFRNIEVIIRQEDIEKKTIMDVEGKLKEMTRFFEMFTQSKYLKRTTPQDRTVIQRLFL